MPAVNRHPRAGLADSAGF